MLHGALAPSTPRWKGLPPSQDGRNYQDAARWSLMAQTTSITLVSQELVQLGTEVIPLAGKAPLPGETSLQHMTKSSTEPFLLRAPVVPTVLWFWVWFRNI